MSNNKLKIRQGYLFELQGKLYFYISDFRSISSVLVSGKNPFCLTYVINAWIL